MLDYDDDDEEEDVEGDDDDNYEDDDKDVDDDDVDDYEDDYEDDLLLESHTAGCRTHGGGLCCLSRFVHAKPTSPLGLDFLKNIYILSSLS